MSRTDYENLVKKQFQERNISYTGSGSGSSSGYVKSGNSAYDNVVNQTLQNRKKRVGSQQSSGVTPGGDSAIMDWMERYNRVMQGVSAYDKQRNGGFTRDASGGFGSEIDSLIADFEGIKEYAADYGFMNSGNYLDQLKQLQNSIQGINDNFSQFEDEDAYNRYLEYWQDQEEKRNLDLDAYSRELEALEQQDFDWTDANQRKQHEAEINRRKQYLTQAQRIQKKDEFAAVADPESEKYDAAFDSKSGYVSTEQDGKLQRMLSQYSMGYEDLTYEYINNQNGIRDTIKQKAGAYKNGETPFEAKGYDYMTEDEVGLYNYYYSMGGKDSAQAYLDTIQEDLNQRKATGMYQPIAGKTGAELLFGVEAGLDQFKGGIQGAVRAVKGDESYVAPSAHQYASQMVREDLADDGFKLPSWLGGASLGQVGYDAITTTANMAPSIAVGMLNPAMGSAALGVSAGGNAYQEALNEGYSVDQARGYGILSGASEVVMERLLGGISAYGGNSMGRYFIQNMKNADTALKRIAREIGGSMLSEFREEYLQEVLTPVFKNLTLGTDEEVKLVSAEALYAGFLGAITGGLLEGPQAIAKGRNATQAPSNATELANNATIHTEVAQRATESATPSGVTEEKSTPDGVTEESSVVGAERTMTTEDGTTGKEVLQVGQAVDGTVSNPEKVASKTGITASDNTNQRFDNANEDPDNTNTGFVTQNRSSVTEQAGDGTAENVSSPESSDGKTEVSGRERTGKTVQISTGENVEIARIRNIDKNGGMTFELSDGRTVDASDIHHGSEGEAVLYEAVADLGASAEVSDILVNNWKNDPGGVSAETYATGMLEAFNYGRYHIPSSEMAENETISQLTAVQSGSAYALGKAFGGELVQTQEANIRRGKAITKARAAASAATKQAAVIPLTEGSAVTISGTGKVHFDRNGRTLSAVQETGLKTMEQLSQLFGTEFHVYESYEKDGKRVFRDENGTEQDAPNGWYDPETGHIHIDLNAGSGGRGTMLFTVAHELTHFIRDWSPAKFDKLAEAVFELIYREKKISVMALVREQQAKAARNGRDLSFDEAYEEVVADSMESILTSGNVVELMAEVKQQDQSLWQKIRQWFQDLAADIRKLMDAYAGFNPDSAEGRAVAAMEEVLPILENFYMDALQEASGNYQAAEGQKNTTQEGGRKNSFKLSDPVTYDDSGNIIPISKRFDNSNSDIRYSQRDPLQEKAVKALEKENARLKEDVQGLKELVKLQGKVTGGKIMKPSSVEAAARVLKKNTEATGNTKELAGLLTDFYSYIAKGEELTWEGVQEAAQGAADWLWANRRKETDEYSAEILKDLRTRGVSFNEEQRSEAAVTHDSFSNYRKALFGSVKITEQGMPLDEVWHELAGLYPSVFPEETNSGDMPRMLVEIVDRLRSVNSISQEYDEVMVRQGLIREVYDSYWNVSTLYTVADVKQKEINRLKSHHAQRMEQMRTEHREKVEQLHQEKKATVEAVRAAERQKGRERTQKVLDKYRENQKTVAANRVQRKEKTELRRKIRRAVMDLDKLLNRGDKKKHVKDGMTSMVGSVLKLADALFMDEYTNRDMLRNGVGVELTDAEEKLFREAQQILQQAESGAAIEGMEFTSEVDAMEQLKKLDSKLSSKMAGLKDVFARERKRLYGTTVSDLLGKLADEYSRLSEAEDGAVRAAKDENVYAHLLQLQKDVGGTTVRDMSLSQLEQVADAFTMVLTTVRNANKMFAKNLQFKRDTLAGMVMGEIGSAAKKLSKLVAPGKDLASVFSWNNLKPVYAFERLGSGTLKTMYQNIRKGQDVWSRDMQEADDFRREQYKKHNRKGWDLQKQHSFEFESGKVDLNLEQIMSLYAYSRREAALDHLLKGGFVFSGNTEVLVKKNGIQRRYLKKDATAYNLSADELMQVIGTLTEEQKAFVVEMQTYLSDTMGGKGNEVSMQMYGIKSFGEKNYFPLRSAGQYMEKAKEDSFRKEQGQISIVNSGFTKATTPHASNPITLDGFMNVWAEHVNDMSMYHGFVLPMEDFRRVYNYSTPNVEEGNSQSVNAAIENAFGKAATGYIDQLYKDLNGGAVSDNRETFSKKLVGLHKKAAVFASASVVIQQPSAIVRAFALIDPRHFIGPKVDRKRHKLLWEEVKQYAPVAFVKEMGYFDTGMGRSARDFLQAEEYTGIREKMAAIFTDADYRDEILGKAPALADEITWCGIWEAVKRETKAKHPGVDVKSDAFLQLAGERFSEVIDKTQVYDSVLSRSANMRSKSGLMNMVTSFMAEPTTSINMLEDALRKGDRKQLSRTVGAVYGSVLLNSLLVSLVYAARDDEEDKTWWEKYLSSVATKTLDGINPITYYPILRDIWSTMQGFDVERADMTLISDFADAAKKMVNAGLKLASASEEERDGAMAAWADSMWGLGDSVASLAGVPLKNIRRDIEACINLYRTIGADLTNRDTSLMSLQDAVLADVINSIPIVGLLYDKSKRDRLYGAIMEGDTVYAQRLKSGYETDSSYHSAIRLAMRDNDSRIWEAAAAWNAGDLETYIRIAKEIRGENRFEQDDIVLAIRAEASAMEENQSDSAAKATGYFTNEKFGVALGQNNTGMADIIRQDLIDTKMANGNTREEAEESVKSAARSLLKELYVAGTITGMNAEKMLVKYGGYDRDSASGKVTQWQYEVDHPELDGRITFSQYKRWEADGKSRGVSLDLFTEVAEYQDSGTSGSNRSQEEVAGYINQLQISTAQKDALWCCFWKESTLHKAPWHN